MTTCGSCGGTGKVSCSACNGTGRISRFTSLGGGGVEINSCTVCYGTGRMKCDFCGGRGVLDSEGADRSISSVAIGDVTNRLPSSGIAILVLGIASWLGLSLLASVPAIILGHKARRDGEGGALSTVGLVLGYLNVLVTVLVVLFLLLFMTL